MTDSDHQSGSRAAIVPKKAPAPTSGPQQVLRDALTSKYLIHDNPVRNLVDLATRAGVSVKSIAKAASGARIGTVDHLRLCAAIEVDPLAGMGPAPYGLHKAYPTPSNFDFSFFAMALTMKQHMNRHDDAKACKAIGIKSGTLACLKRGHAMPIGAVLRACAYVGVHPFGYFAVQKILPESVSRETSARGVLVER